LDGGNGTCRYSVKYGCDGADRENGSYRSCRGYGSYRSRWGNWSDRYRGFYRGYRTCGNSDEYGCNRSDGFDGSCR
jgi:hypothetical protein